MNRTHVILGVIAVLVIAGVVVVALRPSEPAPEPQEERQVLPSGLEVGDAQEGAGEGVKAGDTVTVHYVGTLENGTRFDSSRDKNRPFAFVVGAGQVIEGWEKGILGMKVGGVRTLKIPADLAYGERGAGGVIPPNATLFFEIELLEIR